MKSYILGIHVGHDSSVALVKNGKIVAASAEERFTGLKHYNLLPIRSLEFCLQKENIDIKDISKIVIPSIGRQEDIEVLLGRLRQGTVRREVPEKDQGLMDKFRYLMVDMFRHLNIWTPLVPPSYIKTYNYPLNRELLYIEHHLAHAASAFYTSGFNEKTLVITADGSGDGLSTTVWIGEDNKLTPRLKVGREGSLGAFYGLVTESLGWWVGDGEGKTMGLAPYGNYKKTKGLLDEYLPVYENGKLKKGYNWGFPGIWQDMGGAHFHFADTPKIIKLIKKYGKENIAAEAQRVLEEQLINFVQYWVKKEGVKHLATAGGVFLNVKANQRIWELGLLKDYYIYPDAGDAGISAGAALYGYFKDENGNIPKLTNIYFGPSYLNKEIEDVLKVRQIGYKYLNNTDIVKRVAMLLSENKIIGWFQGRMECGPRALGNRSILMDPRKEENKDIINSRVKYREPFRPFCPSTIDKAANKYFKNLSPNPSYMIISSDVVQQEQRNIPSVTHVDGTARPQVLRSKDNPLFYDLIEEFGKLTGVPVLLNTSFNIRGKPVVVSPEEALQCFYNTGLDYLVIGNFLVSKSS